MLKIIFIVSSTFVVFWLAVSGSAHAQAFGNTPTDGNKTTNDFTAPGLNNIKLIEVSGAAEIRVKPTEIRLVLATVAEGTTANECQTASSQRVQKLSVDLQKIGIAQESIFEDFISILPIYEFEEMELKKFTVMKETLVRFRFQSNLHLKLTDNAQASRALRVAFENGITDIIAFDYWSPDLEAAKTEAFQKAIAAARAKAKIIFDSELFPEKLPMVNFTEEGRVIFPKDMYSSYQNTIEQSLTTSYNWRPDIPRLNAARPMTTYYRGPELTGESLSRELPMKPEISVVSKVNLYFDSPAALRHDNDDKNDDKK
ncbi:MAG: SIMPL domain-containing protein [Pirellulaceae bacterium]